MTTENTTKDNENEVLDTTTPPLSRATDTNGSDVGGDGVAELPHVDERQIKLESSKTTLAKRPWRLGAVEVTGQNPDGSPREMWLAAVIDAEGHAICCGDTPDIEFIIKLENSYDAIIRLLNTSGAALSDAVDVLQDFECKKSKAFKFN